MRLQKLGKNSKRFGVCFCSLAFYDLSGEKIGLECRQSCLVLFCTIQETHDQHFDVWLSQIVFDVTVGGKKDIGCHFMLLSRTRKEDAGGPHRLSRDEEEEQSLIEIG